MSIPLRKPKCMVETNIESPVPSLSSSLPKNEFMILTLKTGKKLVVSSDSFHSIINAGINYKCLVCNIVIEMDYKEIHKESSIHKQQLFLHPHKEDFAENLIRQLDNETCYCSICNVSLPTYSLKIHVAGDGHISELNKAKIRSFNYKPLFV